MAKSVRVISEFQHSATGAYVRPGANCPELDAETEARLVTAGCIVVEDVQAATGAKPATPKKARATPAEKPPEE